MKKIFSFIAAAVLTLSFTGCEDVPVPYGFPNWESIDDGSADEILKAIFSTSLEGFKTICTTGDYPWKVDHSCAQVTAYVDGNNNAADSWLISPEVDLSTDEAAPARRAAGVTGVEDGSQDVTGGSNRNAAHIVFDYILRYANAGDLKKNYLLLISSDYSEGENPAQYNWESLDFNRVLGADWNTWYSSGKINIPSQYIGKKVRVALRYISTTKAATWEVKNFKVKWGAGDYGQVDPNKVVQLPYRESFATSLGDFRSFLVSGTGEWFIDYSTAKATGYDGSKTNAGVYYLVSPIIQLNDQPVQLDYEYILQYFVKKENQQVLINDHFDEANPSEGWVLLNQDHIYGRVDGSGKVIWSVFDPMSIQIPEKYLGKQVRIAFRYETNAQSGSTWEIRNFSIFNGNEGNYVDNIGDETAPNGDFECWVSGKPNNWDGAFTTAEYERTQDAHGGKYAILLKGSQNANVRIAYKAIDLPQGDYIVSAFFRIPEESLDVATGIPSNQLYPSIQFSVLNGNTGSPIAAIHKNMVKQDVIPMAGSLWVELSQSISVAQSYTGVCPVLIVNKDPGLSVIMDDFTLGRINDNQQIERIIY